jgi:hypothetical protein
VVCRQTLHGPQHSCRRPPADRPAPIAHRKGGRPRTRRRSSMIKDQPSGLRTPLDGT